MAIYLGVDAGGTKTELVLGDESRELVRVRTGTIKRMRANQADAARHLDDALAELTSLSGISMDQVAQTSIGTAGETVPLVTEWLRSAFAASVGGGLEIVGDVEIALDASFHGGRGVLILAGTGSNVAARDTRGAIMTAGGWGPAMADQGSGHFLGLEGLRRGFLARDQQRHTRLLSAAMNHWQLTSLSSLIEHANSVPPPDYSSLAPLVVACAAEGDEVAVEVLQQGGRDLAYLASLLIERMRAGDSATAFEPPPVAIAGSILEHVEPLRRAMQQALSDRYSGIQFKPDPVDPVLGALWRARRALA